MKVSSLAAVVLLVLVSCSNPSSTTPGHPDNKGASQSTSVSSSTEGLPDVDHLIPVRFGMEPYGDHTYAIIGVKKGWFKEVGIDLQYQCVKTDDVVPYLLNGTLDVASCPPAFLFSSYENAPNLVTFVFNDLFQGYGIMAQPDGNYRSFSEFIKTGLTPAKALKATVEQMRGKVFAYPAETAIKPFIDLVLSKGGLTRADIKALVLDDPLTINAMRKKQADFQVGGAPSRLILQREGCKCILTANDIARSGKPSPDSPELASILEDGWATTRQYYLQNHDTILRLASVNFRMINFMNDQMDQALSIHMPYLSQVTGQPFLPAEGRIIYRDLDPFITFEQQKDWFHNPNSTYFYKNVNGSILKNFVDQGVYKHAPPKVDEVIVAQDVYHELETLKDQAKELLDKIQKSNVIARDKDAHRMFEKAEKFYQDYDYLDAQRLARQLSERISNGE